MNTQARVIIAALGAIIVGLVVVIGVMAVSGNDDDGHVAGDMMSGHYGYMGMMGAMGRVDCEDMLTHMQEVLGEDDYQRMLAHMAEHQSGSMMGDDTIWMG